MAEVSYVSKNRPNTLQASGMSGASADMAAVQADPAVDSAAEAIRTKIMDAQKQRQELSVNTEISAQEREKRRQKIEQEISDLKRELRLREAEQKKKQQEAKKEAVQKEERQKEAAKESSAQEVSRSAGSQKTAGQAQEDTSVPSRQPAADDGQIREILPDGIQRIISADASIQQFHKIQNTSAKADAALRIQEAELSQDTARGADTGKLQQAMRKEFRKEMQRMDMVHQVIFGSPNNKAAVPETGIRRTPPSDTRANGLYGSNGMMTRHNFQSVQMDVILS